MVLPSPGNSYRDALYTHLFDSLVCNLILLKENSGNSPARHWDSLVGKQIEAVALQNGYRSHRRNSPAPQLYVIGFGSASIDRLASFISGLGENFLLEECAFLAEGYDGEATMLSKASPVTDPKLNTVLSRYGIKPRGRDSFILREQQYDNLREINSPSDHQNKLDIMDCLVRRERDYFLPLIVEEQKWYKRMIFLASTFHIASPTLPTQLNNKGIRYAFFVPRY